MFGAINRETRGGRWAGRPLAAASNAIPMPPRFPTVSTSATTCSAAPLPLAQTNAPSATTSRVSAGSCAKAVDGGDIATSAPLGVACAVSVVDAALGVLHAMRAEFLRLHEDNRVMEPTGVAVCPDAVPARPLTAREIARHLSVTVASVNSWCAAERFPGAYSLGRAGWRIPREALAAFIATMEQDRSSAHRNAG